MMNLLQQVVVDVAKSKGYDFWLKRSIESAADDDVLLYPGLRQVIEVDFIHQNGGFILGLDVPVEVRFERSKLRSRPGDEINFETFKANEAAERHGKGQQIDDVFQKVDSFIENDGDLGQLDRVAAQVAQDYASGLSPRYVASRF